MAKANSLTQYEVDTVEENDVGICCDGHWDNFLLDYGLTMLREYVILLRKIGAKDCLAVIEELIAWVDAELQPDMSQFAVTDKDPSRLESLWQRYSQASLREAPQELARKLAPPPPKNKMPTTDREYYDFFGPENVAKKCQAENCQRGSVKFSAFCRTHHFENVKKKPCPWTD
jgi:hypothetical protein